MGIRKRLNDIRIANVRKGCETLGRFPLQELGDLRGKTFLDFGCGFGEECAQAAELGMKVTAYDITLYPEMQTVQGAYPEIDVRIGGIEVIEDIHVDVIHSNHVIEHVPDDLVALDFFRRHLNPGGMLLLAVPPVLNLKTLSSRFFGGKRFSDSTHVREYTVEEITQKVRGAGFEIVKCNTSGFGLPMRGLPLIMRLLDRNRAFERKVPNVLFLHDSINLICR